MQSFFEITLFVLSTGVFFNECVRSNFIAVVFAGLIASVSTGFLLKDHSSGVIRSLIDLRAHGWNATMLFGGNSSYTQDTPGKPTFTKNNGKCLPDLTDRLRLVRKQDNNILRDIKYGDIAREFIECDELAKALDIAYDIDSTISRDIIIEDVVHKYIDNGDYASAEKVTAMVDNSISRSVLIDDILDARRNAFKNK